MKKQREKYDSYITYLYATGQEEKLPLKFRREIPYTTISNWRKERSNKFKGSEYRDLHDQAFRVAGLEDKNKRFQQQLRNILRSYISLRNILGPQIRKFGNDSRTQKDVLTAIRYLIGVVGVSASLRIIGISRTQYQQWILEAKFKCWDSFIHLCAKRHPHQLSLDEINGIKRMMQDPKWEHWPTASIAAHGLRKGTTVASLYSWYKYVKLLGLSERKTWRKERKTVGLIANFPNEYLHADVTEITTSEEGKLFLCVVMDNFSRMVLGYHISRRCTFEVVIEALENALKVILTHPEHGKINLVTDSGKENVNRKVTTFLDGITSVMFKQVLALKHIQYSNNPVEAVHRILKSRYLYKKRFSGMKDLETHLQWSIEDYNELRPHYRHRPRTPKEVYFNIPLNFSIKRRMRAAAKRRLQTNRCGSCVECKGGCQNKLITQ